MEGSVCNQSSSECFFELDHDCGDCSKKVSYKAKPKSIKEKKREKRQRRFSTSLQKSSEASQRDENLLLSKIPVLTEALESDILKKQQDRICKEPRSTCRSRLIVRTEEMKEFFKLTGNIKVFSFIVKNFI